MLLRFLILIAAVAPTASCTKKLSRDWTPVSPSGDFQAVVTNQVAQTGPLKGGPVWQVIVKDKDGKPVYVEPASMRPWHLNNYWAWDAHDRFWVYDTDVSLFIIWKSEENGWSKSYSTETDTPPDSLKRFLK